MELTKRYHLQHIYKLHSLAGGKLKDKSLLEIGCGKGDMLKLIAEHYHPSMIIGTDLYLKSWWDIHENQEGENWKILEGDAESLSFDDNSFDYIYSISTFEHINNVQKALSEIKRVLKSYGIFYTNFAPIWTSVIGHHCKHWYQSEYLNIIPPWGHLYMDENEMAEHFQSCGKDEPEAKKFAGDIYANRKLINHYTRSELLSCVIKSGMYIKNIAETVAFSRDVYSGKKGPFPSELTEDIKKKISKTKYRDENIGVIGMTFILEKYRDL